jgi:predicted 2-oxoglutarate/Fe(II)-dependent dioxygenase YbiX
VVHWPTNSYELGHYGGNDFNDNGTANQWACVCYLNDNYTGGDTILGTELKHITPKKGKMIIFEGQKIFHGISLVTSGDRFNLMSWWRSDQPKLTTETNGLTY